MAVPTPVLDALDIGLIDALNVAVMAFSAYVAIKCFAFVRRAVDGSPSYDSGGFSADDHLDAREFAQSRIQRQRFY